MIDMRLAREQPEAMRRAIARKGAGELFDELMALDAAWRHKISAVDELRSRTRPKGKPSPEELEALQLLKEQVRQGESELAKIEEERDELLTRVPNPPFDEVPDGDSDEDAIEIKRLGEPPAFAFEIRDHVELGGFDMERGARLSGSRFAYRRGNAALLELAMYRYAIDRLTAEGFELVLPPVLVKEEAMYGTGFLPNEAPNLYLLEGDQLYLTGTSEVALAGLHQGEMLEAAELPLRYAGYSTCFRREAGAAGRDTRGVFRVHQFDKVEMFVFTTPSQSRQEHERLLAIEEDLVQSLGLAYRVVCTAAGDLGAPAAKKYDIEAWIPSQGRYREITSCSNTTDYQARRLNVRYRDDERRSQVVHTLNGTAMTARWLIALMETFQDALGEVAVPEVLQAYGAPSRLGAGSTAAPR
ncbi:MAG TPA: serine--tRNA ligase [Acidimicrobiales bacterium]|jgi:seryl-tRNA synthetase|nr:serine--tRNA ligase [Acidimicrobiales bacterium]